jgi:hypothetical protein
MDQVTFVRGSETVTLAHSKGKDGKDSWKNGAGKDIDAAKADDLLAKLGGLRADKFQPQPDAALKSPALVVTVKFDASKMETVTFARTGTTVVAGRSDDPGSATVEAMSFDEVMKGIDAVK